MDVVDESWIAVRDRKRKAKSRQDVYGETTENLKPGDVELVQVETLVESFQHLSLEEQAYVEQHAQGPREFAAAEEESKGKKFIPIRRVMVPANRYSALKRIWEELIQPLVRQMQLQVRMNTKRRCVEIRPSPKNKDSSSLAKGAEYVKAFLLGFSVQDAIALLRLDDMYLQSFQIKDVKALEGEHLSRCIGRISGKDGKTKHAIENATRTRLVIAGQHIHILGSHQSIDLCRNAVCSLILGSPPGKVYNHLRIVSRRMKERV